MKKIIQIKYEETLIQNKFKDYILRDLEKRSFNSSGDSFWLGRLNGFLHAFFNPINQNKFSKLHFLFDFSINSIVSNYIIFNQDQLKTYLENLPGMPSKFIRQIEQDNKNFRNFILFCEELNVKPEDVLFKTTLIEIESLLHFNGINLDDIKEVYLLRKDYSNLVNQAKVFENHAFLTMPVIESFRIFLKNKEYLKFKSLISQETKHIIQQISQYNRGEYFEFCLDNEINPFHFKDENEEALIDLNFNL
jgi:hypothetical protein